MADKIYKLYKELKEKITINKLKDITVDIINKFKNKDHQYLIQFANMLGVDSSNLNINRIFAQIIQIYHPDKLNKIINEIESLYKNKNFDKLLSFKNIYLIDLKKIHATIDYTYGSYEEHIYAEDDFGYNEYDLGKQSNLYDYEFEDDILEDNILVQEQGFIEAINNLFYGNLDYSISISDLRNLDGELDLSDFEINDLTGIENCINISSLNLSGNNIIKVHQLTELSKLEELFLSENNIEDISCLNSLLELRDLDISFNRIENISVLLNLSNLKYVNVIHNPIADISTIEKLEKRGVIVIY